MSPLRKALVGVGTTIGATAMTLVPVAIGSSWMAPAAAAPEDASGVVSFNCVIGTFPAYVWSPTITVSAVRPALSTTVSLRAQMTNMAGKAPVTMDFDAVDSMKLTVDGIAVTANGSGRVKTTVAYQDFPLPDVAATFNSAAITPAVVVKSFSFTVDPDGMKMAGQCTPTGAGALGTMEIVTGDAPTPTVVPTTMTSAKSKPRASASASTSPSSVSTAGGKAGTAAKGNATFNCRLGDPFPTSTFTYPTSISISGARSSATSSEVFLNGKIDSMPGIVPVELNAVGMRVYLKGTIDGKAFELKGSNSLTLAVKQTIPVPGVSGSASTKATNPAVKITGFRFDTDETGGITVGGTCTVSSPVALSKMAVGVGKSALKAAAGEAGTTGSGAAGGSGSTLPKTGADHVALLLTGGAGLIALGASGLLVLRRIR